MRKSELHFYSLGRVANNKVLNETLLKVIPVEASMFLDGDIASKVEVAEVQGVDGHDNPYTSVVDEDAALTADWLPLDSNRNSPPDMRRGERVLIWRFADSDEFYWSDLGLDQKHRRLETVSYLFSANPEEDNEKGNGRLPENCYTLEVSTHNKTVTFTTTDKNGEFTTYALQLNTDEGYLIFIDDLGNEIELNSRETLIRLENADGTFVRLDKKDIKFYAPNNVEGKVDNDMTVKVGNNLTVEVGSKTVVKTGSTMNLESGGAQTLKAGGTQTLDAPTTHVKGNFKVDGTTTINGGTSAKPFSGPISTI